ncbi:hypothetical protein [Desulfoluna spongiiphila]|uniref:hypothetical protein n=1 Tax=Desulfoluna spongiiphila TaxID=419481 RepID=UPI001252FFA1|nr:hypothetical protein [Desulfoluna spongiiphila]VVS93062.1 hypothetical protein DBB_26300 [Desulfoluna spongiiphila]
MKAEKCMFAWNRESSAVEVGPWPDTTRWSDRYDLTSGAAAVRSSGLEMTHAELIGHLFIEAMHLIIGDKVDPFAVHNEFCKISEYREGLASDIPRP